MRKVAIPPGWWMIHSYSEKFLCSEIYRKIGKKFSSLEEQFS